MGLSSQTLPLVPRERRQTGSIALWEKLPVKEGENKLVTLYQSGATTSKSEAQIF